MSSRIVPALLAPAALSFASFVLCDTARGGDDAIVIHSRGIDRLLVDEKDAALRRALRMLGDRLAELPAETEQPDMPGHLFKLALELMMSPMSLHASMIPGVDPNEAPPFAAQLAFLAPDADTAQGRANMLSEAVEGMMGLEAMPHPELAGIRLYDLDGIPACIGFARGDRGTETVITFNAREVRPASEIELRLPEGVEPAFVMRLDTTELRPLVERMLEEAGPEADSMRLQLGMMGLTGEHPMKVTVAMGHSRDAAHTVMRYSDYLANEFNSAMVSKKPLTSKELDLIPADATMAQVGRARLGGLAAYMRAIFESMPDAEFGGEEDPFAAIQEQTGIHPQTDLLDHLGETFGFYLSDTTGGGGLMSAVAFAELSNEPAMRETLGKIASFVNNLAAEEARGYIQFRSRKIGGHDVTTLSFPGLPVPLEVSSAISGGYLFVAATPQALAAALAEASREGGLSRNARFMEASGGKAAEAVAMSFMDTPRLISSGYGLASMAMSALANAVRSPADPSRDPGVLMPPYHELAADTQAAVSFTWYEGDDLVVHTRADRSMLVNLCGAAGGLGSAYGGVVVAALGAGLITPALGKAQESARQVRSATQLRQVHMAAMMHTNEHDGRFPTGVQSLVDGQAIAPDVLVSPYGPVWDGEGDFWFDFRGQEPNFEFDRIVGYDRAMASQGGMVNVLFEDGHVETLGYWDFLARIEMPKHADIDFNLPNQ